MHISRFSKRDSQPFIEQRDIVELDCDCGCGRAVVERVDYTDGDTLFDVSFQDSRYTYHSGVLERMKNAGKLLFGKPIYYSDVCFDSIERFRDWVNALTLLTAPHVCDDAEIGNEHTEIETQITYRTEYHGELTRQQCKIKLLKYAVCTAGVIGLTAGALLGFKVKQNCGNSDRL
jgi:hypothetical protein